MIGRYLNWWNRSVQTEADGEGRRGRAGLDVEFGEDMLHVVLDRPMAQVEDRCYVAIGLPAREEREDVAFAPGKPKGIGGRLLRRWLERQGYHEGVDFRQHLFPTHR